MQTSDIAGAVTALNIEASNPRALAEFWAVATGGAAITAGEQVYLRPRRPDGVGMYFRPLAGPRPERNLIHADLTVTWGERSPLVTRLLAVGATHQWDVLDEHPSVRWTTLADPEGNLLCVAEHPPSQRHPSRAGSTGR